MLWRMALLDKVKTQDGAIGKSERGDRSFQSVYDSNADLYNAPIPIKELHEFLMLETREPASEIYELRAVYA